MPTTRAQLDRIAAHMVDSYLETASFARSFHDEHGSPAIAWLRSSYLRNLVQLAVDNDDGLELGEAYRQLGRVAITDETGQRFLLRSARAVAIEQAALFPVEQFIVSDVQLVVYRYGHEGLELSIAGTRETATSRRLEPTGTPTPVGVWAYAPPAPKIFVDDADDAFDDLGELGFDEDEAGGAGV